MRLRELLLGKPIPDAAAGSEQLGPATGVPVLGLDAHYLLFSHTATALKMMLLFRGGPQVVVVNAPWYLRLGRPRRRWRFWRGRVPLAARTAES